MELEGVELEHVLIGLGMGVLGLYHGWLVFTIRHNPKRTVIGLNAESRHQWVFSMMADPLKNGVLIVQTIRNNIMASTLLATTAITLCSLISVYVSNESNSNHNSLSSSSSSQLLNVGDRTPIASSVKYSAILICFLVAFLCNVQCIRYYAHVSFLATLPTSKDRRESIEYVVANLNRGCLFWSLGLRAFYLSFPLFLWLFGAIPMFICCCVMAFLLYFLDTTSSVTRQLHSHSFIEDPKANDVESFRRPLGRGVDEEGSGRVRALEAESLGFGRCGSAIAGAGARLIGLESVWGCRRASDRTLARIPLSAPFFPFDRLFLTDLCSDRERWGKPGADVDECLFVITDSPLNSS